MKSFEKTGKMNIRIFKFLSNITIACKIWSQIFQSFWIMKIFFFSGKLNIKASFHLPLSFVGMNSGKVFGDLDVISVN